MRPLLRSVVLMSCVLAPAAARAQSDSAQVLAVVQRLFDGMRASDSAMVRSTMASIIRFAEVNDRATPPRIESDSVNEWLGAVSRSRNRWDERIYDVRLRLDGNLAQVWAPYTFYLDGKISHCGVDALELLKDPSGWKVTQLADTRRRDNCRDVQR